MSLKELRERQGYSIRKLSEVTGISRSQISRIESNQNKTLNIETMVKLSNYFKCTIDDLLILDRKKASVDHESYGDKQK